MRSTSCHTQMLHSFHAFPSEVFFDNSCFQLMHSTDTILIIDLDSCQMVYTHMASHRIIVEYIWIIVCSPRSHCQEHSGKGLGVVILNFLNLRLRPPKGSIEKQKSTTVIYGSFQGPTVLTNFEPNRLLFPGSDSDFILFGGLLE